MRLVVVVVIVFFVWILSSFDFLIRRFGETYFVPRIPPFVRRGSRARIA